MKIRCYDCKNQFVKRSAMGCQYCKYLEADE
jgi:ribosomal protein L37AE/L43A